MDLNSTRTAANTIEPQQQDQEAPKQKYGAFLTDYYSRKVDTLADEFKDPERLAQHAYAKASDNNVMDYDTWKAFHGVDEFVAKAPEAVAQFKEKQAFEAAQPEERGFLSGSAAAIGRGVMNTVGATGQAIGLADLTPASIDTDKGYLDTMGEGMTKWAEDKKATTQFMRQTKEEDAGEVGTVRAGWEGALESLPLTGGVAASAAAGAGIGSLAGPVGTAVGATVGGLVGMAGLFGAGTYGDSYDRTYKELKEKRSDAAEDEVRAVAQKGALIDAGLETGSELVSDLAAVMTLGGSKLVTQPLTKTLKEIVKPGFKTYLLNTAKHMPFEVGSEVVTAYGQADWREKEGLEGGDRIAAMGDAVLPAIFMSAVLGTAVAGYRETTARKTLSDLNADDQNVRVKAAEDVAARIVENTEDKEIAQKWIDLANERIASGEKFDIDQTVTEWAATKTREDAQAAGRKLAMDFDPKDVAPEGVKAALNPKSEAERLLVGDEDITPEEMLLGKEAPSATTEPKAPAGPNEAWLEQEEARYQREQAEASGQMEDLDAQWASRIDEQAVVREDATTKGRIGATDQIRALNREINDLVKKKTKKGSKSDTAKRERLAAARAEVERLRAYLQSVEPNNAVPHSDNIVGRAGQTVATSQQVTAESPASSQVVGNIPGETAQDMQKLPTRGTASTALTDTIVAAQQRIANLEKLGGRMSQSQAQNLDKARADLQAAQDELDAMNRAGASDVAAQAEEIGVDEFGPAGISSAGLPVAGTVTAPVQAEASTFSEQDKPAPAAKEALHVADQPLATSDVANQNVANMGDKAVKRKRVFRDDDFDSAPSSMVDGVQAALSDANAAIGLTADEKGSGYASKAVFKHDGKEYTALLLPESYNRVGINRQFNHPRQIHIFNGRVTDASRNPLAVPDLIIDGKIGTASIESLSSKPPTLPADQRTQEQAGGMASPGQRPSIDEQFDTMVKDAARWQGAARNLARELKDDKRASLRLSKITTKGDLDAYLMRKYGIDAADARSVSNHLTARDIKPDFTATVEEFKDEPWAQEMRKGKPKNSPATAAANQGIDALSVLTGEAELSPEQQAENSRRYETAESDIKTRAEASRQPIRDEIARLEKEMGSLAAEAKKWMGKEYKDNKTKVTTGGKDEFDATTTKTIGEVNDGRRSKAVQAAHRAYNDAARRKAALEELLQGDGEVRVNPDNYVEGRLTDKEEPVKFENLFSRLAKEKKEEVATAQAKPEKKPAVKAAPTPTLDRAAYVRQIASLMRNRRYRDADAAAKTVAERLGLPKSDVKVLLGEAMLIEQRGGDRMETFTQDEQNLATQLVPSLEWIKINRDKTVEADIPEAAKEKLTLKQQKAWLLAEIDKAMKSDAKGGKPFEFHVPGDGHFRVKAEQLAEFKKRVEERFPEKERPSALGKNPPRPTQSSRGRITEGEYYNEWQDNEVKIDAIFKPEDKGSQFPAWDAKTSVLHNGVSLVVIPKKPMLKGVKESKGDVESFLKHSAKEISERAEIVGQFKRAGLSEEDESRRLAGNKKTRDMLNEYADNMATVFAHVRYGDKDAFFHADKVDMLRTQYPDAEIRVSKNGTMLGMFVHGNVVGIAMGVEGVELSDYHKARIEEIAAAKEGRAPRVKAADAKVETKQPAAEEVEIPVAEATAKQDAPKPVTGRTRWFVDYSETNKERTTETKSFATLAEAREFAKGKSGYISKQDDTGSGLSTDATVNTFKEYFGDFDPSAQEGQKMKAEFGEVPAVKREEAKDSPSRRESRTFRDIDTLNALTKPIEHEDWIKFADGSEWQAKQGYTARGWTLVRDGRAHPTIQGIEGQVELVAAVVQQQEALKSAKHAEKIDDFGEKIEGAKKDLWTGMREKMTAVSDDDIGSQPFSKTWPLPDYQAMLDSGVDKEVVSYVRAMRDAIPNKPGSSRRSAYKAVAWEKLVRDMRRLALDILDGKLPVENVRGVLARGSNDNSVTAAVRDQAELYMLVGHEKSLAGLSIQAGEYSLLNGVEYKPAKVIWAVEQKQKATAFSNFPRMLATGSTREEAIADFKKKYDSLTINEPVSKQVEFDIYSYKGKAGFFIGKKIGRNHIDLAGPFATAKEAREYKRDKHDALLEKLAKFKEIPNERRDTNDPRVGEDMRGGQDASPEMFQNAFAFRGVQFGNYVEQGRRQEDLNEAYDALMDMAAILGVPPKALSLNGELGLAFGARGSGGIGAAAAHYEPDNIVINLTKKRGAGSIGHEWFHALDNYFSRLRNEKNKMMTDATDVSLVSRDSDYFKGRSPVRDEMIEAFGGVLKAIRQTAMKARATKLDNKRTKEYWTLKPEMSARAFESYLISKLHDQGASNDYLANIVDEKTWKAAESLGFELEDSYPYPTAGEVPAIRAAFDNFFSVIESKETDKGVALYQLATTSAPSPLDLRAAFPWADSIVEQGWRTIITKGKVSFAVERVETISANEAAFKLAYGRQFDQKNDKIAGDYRGGTIRIAKIGDKWTAKHEHYHFLEDMWLVTKFEQAVLDAAIKKADKAGELGFNLTTPAENRAYFVQHALEKRDFQRKTTLGRVLQKIADFVDALVNLVHRTSRGVVRDVESGKMMGRDGNAKAMMTQAFAGYQAKDTVDTPAFKKWFGKSKARGVFYHWTNNVFDSFSKTSDIGFHFGTEAAAKDRGSRIGGAEIGVEPVEVARIDADTKAALDGTLTGDTASDLYALLLRKLDSPRPDLKFEIEKMTTEEIEATASEYRDKPDSPKAQERAARAAEGGSFRVVANGEVLSAHKTPREARARADKLRRDAAKPMAVYLRVENPIRLPDLGVWPAQEIAKESGFTMKERDAVALAGDERAQYAKVREILMAKGYDGIVYTNQVEDVGTDSYIVFDPTQIKSATGNRGTFDPADQRIQYSLATKARELASDIMHRPEVFGPLKFVQTQYHKKLKNADYGRMWDRVHEAASTQARSAARSAQLAPDILPDHAGSFKETVRELMPRGKNKITNEDLRVVSRVMSIGTLAGKDPSPTSGHRLTDDELSRLERGESVTVGDQEIRMSKAQVGLYRQARKAVDQMVAEMAASEAWRNMRGVLSDEARDSWRVFAENPNVAEQGMNALLDSETRKAESRLAQAEADAFALGGVDTVEDFGKYGDGLRKLRDKIKRIDKFTNKQKEDGDLDAIIAKRQEEIDAMAEKLGIDADNVTEELKDYVKAAKELKAASGQITAINEARETIGGIFEQASKLITAGYVPLSRFGKYRINVTDKDGKLIYVGMYDTSTEGNVERRKLVQAFASSDPGATVGDVIRTSEEAWKLYQGANPDALMLFASKAGAKDHALMQAYYRDALSSRSALKRLIARKGYAGYSEDLQRILASFITSGSKRIGTNYHSADITDMLGQMKEKVDKGQLAGDVLDEAVKMKKYVDDPGDAGSGFRSFAANWYMLGSFMSAAWNGTQALTSTLPELYKHSGSVKKSFADIFGAYRTMVRNGADLTADETKALKRAEQDGTVDAAETFHLWGLATKRFINKLGNGEVARKTGAFLRLWGMPFAWFETVNRKASFIAAYRQAMDVGMKGEEAYAWAKQIVDITQGVYQKHNRVNVARSAAGGAVMTFMQYKIMTLEQIARNAKGDGKAKRAAALQLAIIAAMGGWAALPGVEDIMDLLDAFMQIVGGEAWLTKKKLREAIEKGGKEAAGLVLEKAAADAVGRFMADMVNTGVSAVLPFDVQSRAGMDNILPGVGLLKPSTQYRDSEVFAMAGVPGSMVESLLDATSYAFRGDIGRAAMRLAPNAVAAAVKGGGIAMTGEIRNNAGKKIADGNILDAALQGFGAQPKDKARIGARLRENQELKYLTQQEERSIVNEWADAYEKRGVVAQSAALKAVRERIAEWNRKNPEWPIAVKQSQVMRELQNRRKTTVELAAKSAPKELRKSMAVE